MIDKNDKLDKMLIKIGFYVILTITVAYGLSRIVFYIPNIWKWLMELLSIIFTLIMPLIYGMVIAYILSPLVNKIHKLLFKESIKLKDEKEKESENIKKKALTSEKKRRKKIACVCSILIVYVIVLSMLSIFVYLTYDAIAQKMQNANMDSVIELISNYFNKYQTNIAQVAKRVSKLNISDDAKESIVDSLMSITSAFSNLGDRVIEIIKDTSKNLMNFFLGLIIAFYILLDKKYFKDIWNKFLKLIIGSKNGAKINKFLNEIDVILSNFVRGQLLDCLIVSIISVIVLLCIGIEFSVILGIFAGIANVIPYFGPIIGMIPAAIVGLISGEPMKALLAVACLLVVQQIDGNIIAPKIIGGSVGIHPVFVIIAITIGAYMFGIIGMIIAVPICGIIKIILQKLLKLREIKEEKDGTN